MSKRDDVGGRVGSENTFAEALVETARSCAVHAAVDTLAVAPDDRRVSLAETDPQRRLTRREDEIVDLVCRGLTNGEIAAVLGTRPNTVRNQLASIFKKLDVASRAELAGLVGTGRSSPSIPSCASLRSTKSRESVSPCGSVLPRRGSRYGTSLR